MKNWIIVLLCVGSISQPGGSIIECKDKDKCSDCIQTPNCGWCSTPEFKRTDGVLLERCFSMDDFESKLRCEAKDLISPTNQIQFLEDEALIGGETPIQLRPQRVKLSLRRDTPLNLTFSFRLAENYPIDMYYLMDLSNSMGDDKQTVAQLGNQLPAEMRKRTTNFRIGFGSFVDKLVMPFVSTTPYKLRKPCDEKEEVLFKCAPPFSFRHILSLTSHTQSFQREVESATVSGNLDSPEGGFDAIMQAVVCGNRIGWRKVARKLLVFSTDASFHFAGDGKLGGILEPHDGKCHLNEKGEYTHDTILDYPSVAQINSKVTEKSIAIIFAVAGGYLRDYERLTGLIQGSTAAELSANSSNVIELVNQEYDKITSEVKLSHTLDEGSSPVKIEFFSHCDGQGTAEKGGLCRGVRIGQVVTFTAQVLLSECPADKTFQSKSFGIQVVGLEEQISVEVDLSACTCDCENEKHAASTYDTASFTCGLKGTLECGACVCNPGFYGKFCECTASGTSTGVNENQESNSECREKNATVDCSDRGECFCNSCDCRRLPSNPDKFYYGKYCQCDDLSCLRVNGLLCSGTDHGKCLCSKCDCEEGWEGDACECSKSNEACRGTDGIECSDRGRCVCNRCICNSPDYSGPLCEECQNCPDKCTDMANCILCSVHRNTSNADSCSDACSPYPEIEVVEFAPTSEGKYCSAIDGKDGCTFYFTYSYDADTNELQMKAQKSKSCPLLTTAGGLWLGGSIFLTILLVGLILLLLWWCYKEKRAKLEYARFKEESQGIAFDTGENPLYRNPVTTTKNPMHESNQYKKFY